MREPQPSHVGRSWRACQGSSFRPRAEEGERHPMASATQAQGETHEGQSQQGPFSKGTARDRLQRRIFCPFLPLGRGFVCLLFWFSFCNIFAPQRDTQLRETFTPAPWPPHLPFSQPLMGMVLLPSCFANGCAGPHLQYCHLQSWKTRFLSLVPPLSQSPCWWLGELSAWLHTASGCCCDSTALACNFAFNALYFTPRGDEKLLRCLGAKRRPAESSHSRHSPQEMGAVI